MADFKIDFTAAVGDVDEASLKKASDVINNYLSRNTKLRKSLEIPPVKSKFAEEAFKSINAELISLEGNIAKIKYQSVDGFLRGLEFDVKKGKTLGSEILNVESNVNKLRDAALNARVELAKIYEKGSPEQEQYASRVQELDGKLSRLGDVARTVTGAGFSEIASEFESASTAVGGTVREISTMEDRVTGTKSRVVEITTELGKTKKITQLLNQETGEWETQTEKVTRSYSEVQTAAKKLSDSLSLMSSKGFSQEYQITMARFRQELEGVDLSSSTASDSIDSISQRLKEYTASSSATTSALNSYERKLKEVMRAEIELRKQQLGADPKDKDQQAYITSAQKRVDTLKEEADALKQVALSAEEHTRSVGGMANTMSASQRAMQLEEEAVRNTKAELEKLNAEYKKSKSFIANFSSGLKDAAARIFDYTLIYRALWSAIALGKQSVQTIIELNKSFTDIQMVTLGTKESIKELREEYASLAYEMSSTVQDVAAGANEWLRQGKTAAETAALLRASMVQSSIGSIEAGKSTEYLTSTLNGYQLGAESAMSVVDKLSQVDVKSASSVEDLAIALQRSANSARNAGVDLDTLIGMIATVKEVTQKSASSIGESKQFKALEAA